MRLPAPKLRNTCVSPIQSSSSSSFAAVMSSMQCSRPSEVTCHEKSIGQKVTDMAGRVLGGNHASHGHKAHSHDHTVRKTDCYSQSQNYYPDHSNVTKQYYSNRNAHGHNGIGHSHAHGHNGHRAASGGMVCHDKKKKKSEHKKEKCARNKCKDANKSCSDSSSSGSDSD